MVRGREFDIFPKDKSGVSVGAQMHFHSFDKSDGICIVINVLNIARKYQCISSLMI